MKLEREYATYLREKPRLLADPANRGRYVLIRGEEVIGLYPARTAALEAGYERYGLGGFMVKEVSEEEPVFYFSRNVAPCR